MRVRFLGGLGAKSIRATPDGESVKVGDVIDLPESSIAVMRSHRYQFEAVDEGDSLPAPAPQPVPESLSRQRRREQIARMREDQELAILQERERVMSQQVGTQEPEQEQDPGDQNPESEPDQ